MTRSRTIVTLLHVVVMLAGVLALTPVCSAAATHRYRGMDPSFGSRGIARQPLVRGKLNEFAIDSIVQPDGKILVLGVVSRHHSGSTGTAVIARFDANGSLDRSFGSGGRVLAPFGAAHHETPTAIAIGPGGELVIAGDVRQPSSAAGKFVNRIALAAFGRSGRLVKTFGSGGRVTPIVSNTTTGSTSEHAQDLIVQPDGKLLLLADLNRAGLQSGGFVVERFDANGIPDVSFGDSGTVPQVPDPQKISAVGFAAALVLQSDGRIVVISNATGAGGEPSNPEVGCLATGLTADGKPEAGFFGGGQFVFYVSGYWTYQYCERAQRLAGDKIVLMSSITIAEAHGGQFSTLFELNADGNLNKNFGYFGSTWDPGPTSPDGEEGGNNQLSDLQVAPTGEMYVLGDHNLVRGDWVSYVAGLNQDGSAVQSFGDSGLAYLKGVDDKLAPVSICRQPGRGIVVVGQRYRKRTGYEIELARVQGH
jgi:uncharacterized delta-60 repeat protein